MKLQDLLAPTWQVRCEAARYLFLTFDDACAGKAWQPEALHPQLRALQPSPQAFLAALIAFWALVAERWNVTARDFQRSAADSPRWGDPDLATFPLDRDLSTLSGSGMEGSGVWRLLGRLGQFAGLIEQELLMCLDHPEFIVSRSAARGLGAADAMGDATFDRLLALSDRSTLFHGICVHPEILARHAQGPRLQQVLAGITKAAPQPRLIARLAIVERLRGDRGEIAHAHLAGMLAYAWGSYECSIVLNAFAVLCRHYPPQRAAVEAIRVLATSPQPERRAAAARWLGEHGQIDDHPHCLALALDTDAAVLVDLCVGLSLRTDVPEDLLRLLASRCLGRGDAGEDEPDTAVLDLLLSSVQRVRVAIAEIEGWWDRRSRQRPLSRDDVEAVLQICDLVDGSEAVRLLPGLHRAAAALPLEQDCDETADGDGNTDDADYLVIAVRATINRLAALD